MAIADCKNNLINLVSSEQYHDYKDLSEDTITNIKRNRDWYWINRDSHGYRESYEKIAEKNNITKEAVAQAITNYRSLVSS